MCCNQWEKWDQWDDEDHRVAQESLRAQIHMLRAHPSAFLWANGSDGLPPRKVRDAYRRILGELHWQNAIVDTVSAQHRDASGNRVWDGIHMEGPYSWRPPSYWFSQRVQGYRRRSCAEQGDNEHIPPLESLKKFHSRRTSFGRSTNGGIITPDRNQGQQHAGKYPGRLWTSATGLRPSAAEFAAKAQIAHYENTRAQFEAFAAGGWDNHKMTHVLDAQQPVAVVFRAHLRLLPEARRRLLRRQEGPAAR